MEDAPSTGASTNSVADSARRTTVRSSGASFLNSAMPAAVRAAAVGPSRPKEGMAVRLLRSPGALSVRCCSTAVSTKQARCVVKQQWQGGGSVNQATCADKQRWLCV